MLATGAGAVVMLSAMLLLGYLDGMMREQERIEAAAQAELLAESTMDWVLMRLAGDMGDPVLLEAASISSGTLTAGVRLTGRTEASPVLLEFAGQPSGSPVLPSGGGILVLRGVPEGMSVSLLEPGPDGEPLPVATVGVRSPGVTPVPTGASSPLLCILLEEGAPHVAHFVGRDGTVTSVEIPELEGFEDRGLLLEAGVLEGVPALAAYSGGGPAVVASLAGAVLAGDDALAASISLEGAGPPAAEGDPDPTAVMRADLDMDGSNDLVMIGRTAVTAHLTSTGGPIRDLVPGHAPVAWGVSRLSSGAVFCWEGQGSRTWRRLGWAGFQGFLPGGAYLRHPWKGRLYEAPAAVAGDSGEGLLVASLSTGGDSLLVPGSFVFTDIDGGDPDAFTTEGGGGSMVLDVFGGGSDMTWSVTVRDAGGILLERAFRVSVSTGGDGLSRTWRGEAI